MGFARTSSKHLKVFSDEKGNIPTIRGDVEVEWRVEGDEFHLTVSAPEGVPVTLDLPDGTSRTVPEAQQFRAVCTLQMKEASR